MTFARVVPRTQISEVLTLRRTLSSDAYPISDPRELPRLAPQSVAALWSEDPARSGPELPEIFVTADGAERDWIAWLATFAPNVRPWTAYCRVLSVTSLVDRWSAIRTPDLGRLGRAAIGVILGELFSSSEDAHLRLREPITVPSCASVLSFSLSRAVALYSRPIAPMEQLARCWTLVRDLTRQRHRVISTNSVVSVMRVLGQLASNDVTGTDDTSLACLELLDRGELARSSHVLGPEFGEAAHKMAGATREERLGVLEALLTAVAPSLSEADGFRVGYVTSRMDPGSFAHARLLSGVLRQCPSALLWYGLCAGLSEGSPLLNEFGGVGRRVLRDLLAREVLVGRPHTDIAVGELDVLFGGRNTGRLEEAFPTGSPSTLSVELDVGVSTAVNWGRADLSRQMERLDERGRVDSELAFIIQRLVEIQKRFRPQLEPPDEPSDPSAHDEEPLFASRRKERRPTKRR